MSAEICRRRELARYCVFDGSGTASIRAALEDRAVWHDGAADEAPDRSLGEGRPRQNGRCHRAVRRGGLAFVWRHLSPSKADAAVVVNKWLGIECLTAKDRMLKTLLAYASQHGLPRFGSIPISHEVPGGTALRLAGLPIADDPAWRALAESHAAVASGSHPDIEPADGRFNLWLLKPSRGCGGAGIFIDSDLQSLIDHASSSPVGCWVAQKYLERPLLFHGRKFDLRVWVLVSSAPETSLGLWVRVYKEGYLRTSSQRYTLDAQQPVGAEESAQETETSGVGQVTHMSAAGAGDCGASGDGCRVRRAGRKPAAAPCVQSKYDLLVHLTNHCQQRTADSLGRFEEGNTASYAALEKAHPELDLRGRVLPQVNELIASSILAARPRLLATGGSRGPHVHAMLGYDFMLHQSGRPLLIEVNANPMLTPQAGWHGLLVRRLMHDYVQVALDPLFPPAAPPPPPLDGEQVAGWQGSGWITLLAAGPCVPPAQFATKASNGGLVLHQALPDQAAAPVVARAAAAAAAGPTYAAAAETHALSQGQVPAPVAASAQERLPTSFANGGSRQLTV